MRPLEENNLLTSNYILLRHSDLKHSSVKKTISTSAFQFNIAAFERAPSGVCEYSAGFGESMAAPAVETSGAIVFLKPAAGTRARP